MKPEIKQRIEQIKNGEIPKGYKKGKLGIVPEDWEEVCFSSLFTSTSNYTDDLEKYPLYSLTIEDGITAKTDRYNRSHLVKKENSYKIVRPNDYAYNPMNIRFGAVARHKGDTPVAVSGYYDIFTTVHQSDLPFMDNFLTCGAMITYYNKVSTGSLVEKQRVHFSDFLKFSLPLPPLAERERIAKILSAQDKVIECYEKKIEQLKRMKKYYLQNMFPKRGETVPKIRFKGFTDPWEQRKLSDLIEENLKPIPKPDKEYVRLGIRSHAKGTFHEVVAKGAGLDVDTMYVVEADNLIVNITFAWEEAWAITSEEDAEKLVSHRFPQYRFHNDQYPMFHPYRFRNGRMKYNLELASPGGAGRNRVLNKTEFLKIPVIIPTSYKEEKQIGEYFQSLDDLITLHQNKLEKEKKKKKALQQLLLTGIVRV